MSREKTRSISGYSGKNILITGGRGYIAASVVEALKGVMCSIELLDRSPAPVKRPKTLARVTDIAADIRDPRIWRKVLKGIDVVFYFAGQTSVKVADMDPLCDHSVNVLPFLELLETCRKVGSRPVIIFAGTVTSAGIPEKLPVDETFQKDPATFYDLHKLMAEQYLRYYSELGAVRGAILRLANVYGPGPRSSSADRGILNQMIWKALKGEDITLYGSGKPIRDYIYVGDVADAFLAAGLNADKVNGRSFIIGSGRGYSLGDAFRLVRERAARRTGKMSRIVRVKPPVASSAADARNFIADPRLFARATGWRPRYDMAGGIDAAIEYYLGNGS